MRVHRERIAVLMANGFTLTSLSLHHHGAGHLRVNRTKVRIGSRFREREGELFIRVHYLGLERLRIIHADTCMRAIVAFVPGSRGSWATSSVAGVKLKLSIFTSVV